MKLLKLTGIAVGATTVILGSMAYYGSHIEADQTPVAERIEAVCNRSSDPIGCKERAIDRMAQAGVDDENKKLDREINR